jgi:hypothetical protein
MSEWIAEELVSHRHANLVYLLDRIVEREALDSDFRLFFVEMRDLIEDQDVRKLLHASAHSTGLSNDLSPHLEAVERAAYTMRFHCGKNSTLPGLHTLDAATFEYTRSAAAAMGRGDFSKHYEKKGGVYLLKKGRSAPIDIFQSLFGVMKVRPAISRNQIAEAIATGVKNSGLVLSADPKPVIMTLADDIVLALIATLSGLRAMMKGGTMVTFNFHLATAVDMRADYSFETKERMETFGVPLIESGLPVGEHFDPKLPPHFVHSVTREVRSQAVAVTRNPDKSVRLVSRGRKTIGQ